MKYMQVSVEYDYQTIHGLMTERIGVIANPNLKGRKDIYSKIEHFIKKKFCSPYSGRGFQGMFIKGCEIIHCSKCPVFDVE